MRRSLALSGALVLSVSALHAGHPYKYDGTSESRLDRFVQRAPLPRTPVEHSAARAGFPQSVRPHAVPSVTRFDNSGYVGGGSLRNNDLRARGPGSALGPIYDGVYATDYTGFFAHMGRVFLAPSTDPSRGRYFYRGYWAEGPRVTNVFGLLPLRKAVLKQHEDKEKREHGEHGHGAEGGHGGEGGHGADAGHAPEGAKKDGKH